jgi:hypothetical protein
MTFSIRDLLFVKVIVALALGWFIDRARRARARNRDSTGSVPSHRNRQRRPQTFAR